ncbi:MAG: VWA-like domain-containing protein, partial [Planctomycetota bacterium]
HLSAFMGRDEFSRGRPNRRWMGEGLVVPGCHDEKVGRVVVALDTSGSMSPELLGEVIAEIKPLMEQVLDLDLVVADAKVQEVVSLDALPAWLGRGEAAGGGGTSHVPVFEWVARKGNPPDLFIGLTDLHTELPPRRPNYPILWVVPERHGQAEWGTVVVAD